jgi:hypothetical protein
MDKQELEMMIEGVEQQLPEDYIEYVERMKRREMFNQLAPQSLPETLPEWLSINKTYFIVPLYTQHEVDRMIRIADMKIE